MKNDTHALVLYASVINQLDSDIVHLIHTTC